MANPASIGFPQVTLETPQLVLRAFEPGDLPDVAVAGADELTQRWLPLPRPYTVEEARAPGAWLPCRPCGRRARASTGRWWTVPPAACAAASG